MDSNNTGAVPSKRSGNMASDSLVEPLNVPGKLPLRKHIASITKPHLLHRDKSALIVVLHGIVQIKNGSGMRQSPCAGRAGSVA